MSRLAVAAAILCSSVAHAAVLEVAVRDASGAPVTDAAVYAIAATGPTEARGARSREIEQIDREFVPYVTVVQAGTTVTFPNRDPILHHVYSFSPAKSFEIKLYTGKSPEEIVFDKPGIVTLGCNIHDWMIAYIVVVPTAHFARTDASGKVRLRDLPAGAYEVHAWHPNQRSAVSPQGIALDAQASGNIAFVIETSPRRPRYKPPFDRQRY
jgi:plastocyanin